MVPYRDDTNIIQTFECVLNVPLDVKGSQRVRRGDDIIETNVVRK